MPGRAGGRGGAERRLAAALSLAEARIGWPSADPWSIIVLSNVLRFHAGRQTTWTALTLCFGLPDSLEEDRRNIFSSAYPPGLRGLAELDQARFDLAERHAQDAMRPAEEHVGAESSAAELCASSIVELRYEQGRLDEAESWVIDRIPVIDAVVMMEGVLRTYIVLARIAAARSNIEHAYALLAQAETLGYNRQWDRLVVAVLLERMKLHLFEGRLSEASACVMRMERLAAANATSVACARSQIHRDCRLARAELALAQSRWTEACDILEGLHRRCAIRKEQAARHAGGKFVGARAPGGWRHRWRLAGLARRARTSPQAPARAAPSWMRGPISRICWCAFERVPVAPRRSSLAWSACCRRARAAARRSSRVNMRPGCPKSSAPANATSSP